MASTAISSSQPSPGNSTGSDRHVMEGLRLPLQLLQLSREDADVGNVGKCPFQMHCSSTPSSLCRCSLRG